MGDIGKLVVSRNILKASKCFQNQNTAGLGSRKKPSAALEVSYLSEKANYNWNNKKWTMTLPKPGRFQHLVDRKESLIWPYRQCQSNPLEV